MPKKSTPALSEHQNELIKLAEANPLIDPDGDTYRVRMVLATLRELIDKAGSEGQSSLEMSPETNCGICTILEACEVALFNMELVNSR